MTEDNVAKKLDLIYKEQKTILSKIANNNLVELSYQNYSFQALLPFITKPQLIEVAQFLHKNPETGLYRQCMEQLIEFCLYEQTLKHHFEVPIDFELLDNGPNFSFLAQVSQQTKNTPIIEHYLTNVFNLLPESLKPLNGEEKKQLFRKNILKHVLFEYNIHKFFLNFNCSDAEKFEAFLEKHSEEPVEATDNTSLPRRFNKFHVFYKHLTQEHYKNQLLSHMFDMIPLESVLNPVLDPPHYWAKIAFFYFPIFLKFAQDKDPQFLEKLKNTQFFHKTSLPTQASEDMADTQSYEINGLQFYFLHMSTYNEDHLQNKWSCVEVYFEKYREDIFTNATLTTHFHDKTVSFMDILLQEKNTNAMLCMPFHIFTLEEKQIFAGIVLQKFLQTPNDLNSSSAPIYTQLQNQMSMFPSVVLENIMARRDFQTKRKELENEPDFSTEHKSHFDFLDTLLEKNKLSSRIVVEDNTNNLKQKFKV